MSLLFLGNLSDGPAGGGRAALVVSAQGFGLPDVWVEYLELRSAIVTGLQLPSTITRVVTLNSWITTAAAAPSNI